MLGEQRVPYQMSPGREEKPESSCALSRIQSIVHVSPRKAEVTFLDRFSVSHLLLNDTGGGDTDWPRGCRAPIPLIWAAESGAGGWGGTSEIFLPTWGPDRAHRDKNLPRFLQASLLGPLSCCCSVTCGRGLSCISPDAVDSFIKDISFYLKNVLWRQLRGGRRRLLRNTKVGFRCTVTVTW